MWYSISSWQITDTTQQCGGREHSSPNEHFGDYNTCVCVCVCVCVMGEGRGGHPIGTTQGKS